MRADYCPVANDPCQCMCVAEGNGECCLRKTPPPPPPLTVDEKLQIALDCNMRVRTGYGAVKFATAIETAVRCQFGALESLEQLDGLDTETEIVTIYVSDEIEALRKALAEPEQSEPVGYWDGEFSDGGAMLYEVPQESVFGRKYTNQPLFAHPPRREPLTDEQIEKLTLLNAKLAERDAVLRQALDALECQTDLDIKMEKTLEAIRKVLEP